MSHNVEAMFWAQHGGMPWHGLGTPVAGNLASEDALRMAGLDWTVRTQHVYVRDMRETGERKAIEVPGARAIVRSDTSAPLGIATDTYQCIQNADVFSTFTRAVGDAAIWHTAGSLRGGCEVWALAEIPGDWKVAGGAHKRYVLGTCGHDGKHSGRWLPTDVTVVCNNTLNAALSQGAGEGFTVTHRGDVAGKLQGVTEAFNDTFKRFDDFKVRMETLADVGMSRERCAEILETVLLNGRTKDDGTPETLGNRDQHALERILDLSVTGRGADTWGGSAYGLLQATSDYVDHDRMQDVTAERRFLYQTEGAGSRLKARMEATLLRECTAVASNGLLDSILATA